MMMLQTMIVKNGLIKINDQYPRSPRQTIRITKTTSSSFDALSLRDRSSGRDGIAPGGPPLPLAPPCNRQRPFLVAGDRQGLPLLVRAPHRRAVWNWTGCWFLLSAFIGLLVIFP